MSWFQVGEELDGAVDYAEDAAAAAEKVSEPFAAELRRLVVQLSAYRALAKENWDTEFLKTCPEPGDRYPKLKGE